MGLEQRFDALRSTIMECERALRDLEQVSKTATQHVETSVYVVRSRRDRM